MSRTRVSVYVDTELDRTIEHLAVDLGMKKYEIYELGARAIVELITTGTLSEQLRSKIARMHGKVARAGLAAPATA
ncbi:hypothetical protein Pyrde_0005 [Pyrodictium delaneyi]|uniref:Uncharacterized protein n=1 Tax=Pyrodictium delaneyi TaxID=1273541 RepID=A0A0P0N1S1_9CREN|nr:hypothetical protein [Pyrodictium delaneyi]ALL00055.1 hypothetical protein Pyrde_0005 [Pyrodictium delaneyi]